MGEVPRKGERQREQWERDHRHPDRGLPVEVTYPLAVVAREEAGGHRNEEQREAGKDELVQAGGGDHDAERGYVVDAAEPAEQDRIACVEDDVDEVRR